MLMCVCVCEINRDYISELWFHLIYNPSLTNCTCLAGWKRKAIVMYVAWIINQCLLGVGICNSYDLK
uniref:Uncharacterized protein n=1 Tax=Octopus bimaculoides TaxID=37653 RepID=A0A0L8FFB7_OCTBM